MICHGIPDDRPLEDGDIVNIDVTAYLDGVHGDCNATFFAGEVDAESQALVEVTRECRDLGIAAVRPGRPISDIGRAIETHASAHGYGVVRMFVGHGIGEQFHISPSVPHYYTPDASTIMEPGMTFTIEPMITLGTWREKMWDNGWTAVTADGRRTAQFEHTLVVTDDGAEVLTLGLVTAVSAGPRPAGPASSKRRASMPIRAAPATLAGRSSKKTTSRGSAPRASEHRLVGGRLRFDRPQPAAEEAPGKCRQPRRLIDLVGHFDAARWTGWRGAGPAPPPARPRPAATPGWGAASRRCRPRPASSSWPGGGG